MLRIGSLFLEEDIVFRLGPAVVGQGMEYRMDNRARRTGRDSPQFHCTFYSPLCRFHRDTGNCRVRSEWCCNPVDAGHDDGEKRQHDCDDCDDPMILKENYRLDGIENLAITVSRCMQGLFMGCCIFLNENLV